MEGDGFQIGDGFLVKFRRFQGSVDDGRAEFRHTRIGESLENDFPADAVRITLRDAYFEFAFGHRYIYFNLQRYILFRIGNAPDRI